MYQYILFDLDGTLSDPKAGITASVQYALKAFGIEEPDADKLEPFIGPPLLSSFMEFYDFSREQAELAVAKYRERFERTGWRENAVYPGIPELLEELSQKGAHLAVASSKPKVFVDKILRYFEIDKFFEVSEGSELDGRRSRKEEVVEEALSLLYGGERREDWTRKLRMSAMVGDRRFDVEGGRAFGLHTVGVRFGYAFPGELEEAGAERIAGDVAQLREILLDGE